MVSRFLQKAEHEIFRKLGSILLEIKDPRLDGCYSLSRVSLSADLGHLKCWFVINENLDRQAEMLEALRRAVPFLRRRLGESIRFKRTPAIKIFHDQGPERIERIEEVIEQLHESGQLPDDPVFTGDPGRDDDTSGARSGQDDDTSGGDETSDGEKL